MQRFERILAGVELADETHLIARHGLRERCANALAKATWLAARTGAELRIVHALPLGPRTHDLLLRQATQGAASLQDLAAERIETLARGAREFGVRASGTALIGAAAATLRTEARRWRADLIVVADLPRASSIGLLGSTAARLFRTSDVPVWIARRGTRVALRDVLAAVTFDEHAHAVLRLAADTARWMGARLHALHVVRDGDAAGTALALDALDGWTRAHAADVPRGSIQALRGDPADAILRTAADVPADAVFVGPSRRSALLDALAGSTTPLLKRLTCSLICARGVSGSPRRALRGETLQAVAAG